MILNFPFSSKRSISEMNVLSNILHSQSDSNWFSDLRSESAFKTYKRSVDLPYENWAFIQTLCDMTSGQLTFNYVASALLSYASGHLIDGLSNEDNVTDYDIQDFMKRYNLYIIQRLKSENKPLFNTLKDAISLISEDDSNV